MPNYTLYYFNGRGRAEILRMMFAAAGVQFNDKRFEFNEWDKFRNDIQCPYGADRCNVINGTNTGTFNDKRFEFNEWYNYRNDMPCMCVPVLEMDGGMKMPETMAIARYLAREYNFYPKNNMDMMRCDYIADCFYEIMHDYMRYYHWKNGRFRFGNNGMVGSEMAGSGESANFDNYLQWRYMNTLNRVMPFMERTLDMRDGGKNFFMGEQMMWCDMMCYCCLENPYTENQAMFSKYPKLMALRTRIEAHPKIGGYLKSRSNTNW